MKRIKVLAVLIVLIMAVGSVLSACGEEDSHQSDPVSAPTEAETAAPTELTVETQAETQKSAASYVSDAWLTELQYVKKGEVEVVDSNTVKSNTGNEYSHYLYSKLPYSEIVYNLNGDYDTLTAVWAISFDDRNNTENNDFDIYADNKVIYSSETIKNDSIPVDVSVDITGCKILTIIFKEGSGSAFLADVKLSNKSEKEKNPSVDFDEELPCWLTDMEYFQNSGVNGYNDRAGLSNTNESYSHVLYGKDGSEIVYYLNGRFETLTGLWSICQRDKDTTAKSSFELFADDQSVYSSPAITGKDTPVKVEANINYCEKLRVVFKEGNGEAEFGNIRLNPGASSALIHPSLDSLIGEGDWLTGIDYLSNKDVNVCEKDTAVSNTGETFSHYLYGDAGSEIVYYLKGEYAKLTGVWTINQRDRDTANKNTFELYADDKLVYTSPTLTGGDIPATVEQDITGCQKLKILFKEGDGEADLVNIQISK